jgi:hypothetical protein
MNIKVHIERLVLDGLAVGRRDGPTIQDAVETELGRLLSDSGLADNLLPGGAMPSVRAPGMQLANDNSPTQLGQQIARAVYGGIGK